jgi:hypothetical protein
MNKDNTSGLSSSDRDRISAISDNLNQVKYYFGTEPMIYHDFNIHPFFADGTMDLRAKKRIETFKAQRVSVIFSHN